MEEKIRDMGDNLDRLERAKGVLKGDITSQFTDIVREAAAELNLDDADFQVLVAKNLTDAVL